MVLLWLTRHRTRPQGALVLSNLRSTVRRKVRSHRHRRRHLPGLLAQAQGFAGRPRVLVPGVSAAFYAAGDWRLGLQPGRERPPCWPARPVPGRSQGSLTPRLHSVVTGAAARAWRTVSHASATVADSPIKARNHRHCRTSFGVSAACETGAQSEGSAARSAILRPGPAQDRAPCPSRSPSRRQDSTS